MPRNMDMIGKAAIVTGGARNIGLGIVSSFLEAGADVIIADLNPPEKDESALPARARERLHFHKTDIAREEDVVSLMAMIQARFAHLDILVNNAGICIETPLADMTLAQWHKVMNVNVTGVFLMTKHAFPLMRSNPACDGTRCRAIVNISSIEGVGANPLHSVYAASKGAVASFTRNTALEYGPFGIRCNAIAPGWINTPFNEALLDKYPDRAAVDAEITALHPLGKLGVPADIGATALWLASDAAEFINGQIITVDGGRTAKLPLPKL